MKKIIKLSSVILSAFLLAFFSINVFASSGIKTKEDMKISVIIPVYNVERYLHESMNSVINQTYKNLEIICVNDGSKDNSLNLLNELAKRDKRIKVISQENKGVSAARNTGLANATGDYITFFDPDDILELNTYETALAKIEKDVDIIVWGYKTFPEDNRRGMTRDVVYTDNSVDAFFKTKFICGYVWNKLYKSEMIKNNNIKFNEDTVVVEDLYFNMNVFVFAHKIQFISDRLSNYNISNLGSLSKTSSIQIYSASYKKVFADVLKQWKEKGALEGNEHIILEFCVDVTYCFIDTFNTKAERQQYAQELLDIFWSYFDQSVKEKLSPEINKKLSFIEKMAK